MTHRILRPFAPQRTPTAAACAVWLAAVLTGFVPCLDAGAQNAPAAQSAAQPATNQPATSIPAARPAPGAPANGRPAAAPPTPAAAPASAVPPAKPAPAAAAEPPKAEPAAAERPKPAAPAKKNGTDKAAETPPEPAPKPGPLKPPSCAVAEFRAIGIDTTDEQTRRTKAAAWLKRKAKDCTAEQLIVIRNNRSQWLGSADSAELAAAIDGLLEAFAETNREVSLLLYGTPPPPPAPPDDKNKAAPKK
jgi:hypothetical protein